MEKSNNFKGKIYFSPTKDCSKKTLMNYFAEPLEAGFEQTFMSSFDFLNFSDKEKKQLSKSHRKVLSNYRQINPFALNVDAQELISHISSCKSPSLIIEAKDYGAYICLAALYSGKLPTHKKIEFHFTGTPLALFPKSFLKFSPVNIEHKIVYHVQEDCWLGQFTTLHNHEKIKCSYKKSA